MTWATPLWLYERFNSVFKFRLDPCCTISTAKCERFFTPRENGLEQDWSDIGNAFVNPPYGKEIHEWVKKSYEESKKGITVALLIPARTDTRYWHNYCFNGTILFFKRKIVFENGKGNKNAALFPSALVIFGKINQKQMSKLSDLGVWVSSSI